MLKDKDIKSFETVLSKKQISQFCLEWREGDLKLKTRHRYCYQVQMQLAVTGLKWCDFVVWSSVSYTVDRVLFDHTFWNATKPKLLNFYHKELSPEFFEMRIPRNLKHIVLP